MVCGAYGYRSAGNVESTACRTFKPIGISSLDSYGVGTELRPVDTVINVHIGAEYSYHPVACAEITAVCSVIRNYESRACGN